MQATNTLSTNLGLLITGWGNAVEVYNQQIFNGSDPSIASLQKLIQDGKVLSADFQVDTQQVQNIMTKAIYGYLIPQAWSLSNKDINVAVMYAQPL